jgi:hypothetical protein
MAILTDKLIDGHLMPYRLTNAGAAIPLARELLPSFRYLSHRPFARLHPLSYLFIFRGGLLPTTHSLVPLRYSSGVIARHALGQLAIRKDAFINISIRFLHREGGEYTLELAIAAVGANWRWHSRAVLI